jgi:uncharacterized membrane protein
MALALALHVLAAVIWVGGMFFAYMALRPAAASLLEPPLRLPLWSQVFRRFFVWVWAAVVILPVTGTLLLHFGIASAKQLHVQAMMGLGTVMILLYMHVFFAPYRRMNQAIAKQDWPEAGRRLGQIRKAVAVNLSLGLATTLIAAGGRLF